jgi:xanthine dehydrogenase accessory factor
MTTANWSVPETAVMDAIADCSPGGVLATVVAVEGSAYRRPGAKIVVTDEGDGVGSITAGCLEDEVRSLAAAVLDDGTPRIERFDLTGDDGEWGLGLGCNGVIDVLFEPLDGSYQPVVDAYREGDDVAVLTVVESGTTDLSRGEKALAFPTDGSADGDLDVEATDWPDWVLTAAADPVARLLADGTSERLTLARDDDRVDVFVDSVLVPPKLVVFGSGHDVRPVVALAKQVDFQVTVVTFRGATASEDRFPEADRVLSTSPAAIRDAVDFDRDTYAVVMSHNFIDDRLAVAELLATEIEYVGLMGPRDRFEEMLAAFAAEDRTFSDEERERIYTPAGLDLGGGTPVQIAHSIVAEVTAVHNDREPGHLSERDGPIHDRSAVGEE